MRMIKISAAVAALVCLMAACKKDDDKNTTRDQLIGNWQLTQEATDSNGNNSRDASEIVAVTDTATLNIKGDGTQTFTVNVFGIPLSVAATWKLTNGDKWIETTVAGQTSAEQIETLTTTSLILKDTADGEISWSIYTKK